MKYVLLAKKHEPMETARVRENRLLSGVDNYSGNIIIHQIPPVKSGELGMTKVSPGVGLRQAQ